MRGSARILNFEPLNIEPLLQSSSLDGPVFGEIIAQFFIFRTVARFLFQTLQCLNDFFLIHFQRVRDHTRGLFEAEASIVVSAAHALQNVKIFFVNGHKFLAGIGN